MVEYMAQMGRRGRYFIPDVNRTSPEFSTAEFLASGRDRAPSDFAFIRNGVGPVRRVESARSCESIGSVGRGG